MRRAWSTGLLAMTLAVGGCSGGSSPTAEVASSPVTTASAAPSIDLEPTTADTTTSAPSTTTTSTTVALTTTLAPTTLAPTTVDPRIGDEAAVIAAARRYFELVDLTAQADFYDPRALRDALTPDSPLTAGLLDRLQQRFNRGERARKGSVSIVNAHDVHMLSPLRATVVVCVANNTTIYKIRADGTEELVDDKLGTFIDTFEMRRADPNHPWRAFDMTLGPEYDGENRCGS